MSKKIQIKDCFNLWNKPQHTLSLSEGVNVLVGANGTGKTTTINQIREYCKEQKIDFVSFDNLSDGGQNQAHKLSFGKSLSFLASFVTASEGQQILQCIGEVAGKIGQKVNKVSMTENKTLFLLFDAIDSGLSIDNIKYIKKDLFDLVIEDCASKNIELYIIVTANSYEMVNGKNCIDVKTGKSIKFNSYEDYANFICAK